MKETADLLAATADVVRLAATDPLDLPDISRATAALEQHKATRVYQSDCPSLVPELLRSVPVPPHVELAALLHSLIAAAPALRWTSPYAEGTVHPDFHAGYFVTTLLGSPTRSSDALLLSAVASVFLTVQAPHLLYPAHSHLAPELYCAVAGTADWQKGTGRYETQPAGAWMVHPPWASHSMQTRDDPLIALAIWTADLDSVAVIDEAIKD